MTAKRNHPIMIQIMKCLKDRISIDSNSAGASDDGYAKVLEKKRINIDEDSIDGYSKVKATKVMM
ncbi:hypothetical protein DOY81_013731 [Sarcophaga bullata]|nr:hypothetical protein DOY81_013731 [Sarcophaga bullata]